MSALPSQPLHRAVSPVLRALAANGLPTEEFSRLAGPIGVTPKETIHAEGTLKLQHFRPQAESVYRVPVLIVTSLVNQPYILDLVPGQSMVEHLLRQGYDVYMIEWGRPRREHAGLTLEDHVLDRLPRCVERVLEHSGERELSIIVPGTEVAKELDRAYKELGARVRMKGFRQGKIPRYVLEQYYKADTEQQVLERVVGAGFREAIKVHSIEPVANPEIKAATELLPGMDFTFSAKVEVKPAIEIKEYKGLKLVRTKYEVTDADVEKEITGLRERQAKVAPVEGRDTAQQGDIVETNWSGTVDGEHVKGLSGLSYAIEIGGGVFPYKDAEQALVGKKVGETFTVTVKIADDFRVESARGKDAVLTFNVLGLKSKTLPTLDDEFAKDVAEDVNTLAELRAKIKTELEKVAQRRTEGSQNDAAVDALIEKNPFTVPEALVDRTAENLVVERLQQLPPQQAEMLWQSQSTRLKEDARPRALRQVRISLILEELLKKEGIEVTDADLEAHYEKIAADMGTSVKSVKQVYKKGRRSDELKAQLGAQRVLDKVIESASWTDQTKGVYA